MLHTLPNGLARVKEVQVGELPVEEMHKAECIPALRITRAHPKPLWSKHLKWETVAKFKTLLSRLGKKIVSEKLNHKLLKLF